MSKVVALPSDIFTQGKWYQPYIHSTPHTYEKSQKRRAKLVQIGSARAQLLEMATVIFDDLYNYYLKREIQLAQKTGTTHENLKNNLTRVFNNFTSLYNDGVTDSSFGILDNLAKGKKRSESYDKMVNNPKAIKASLINLVNEAMNNKSKSGKINQSEKFKKESIKIVEETASWAAFFARQNNITNIDDILSDVTRYMVYGGDLKDYNKDVHKFMEQASKAQPSIEKILNQLRSSAYPFLKEASQKTKSEAGDPRQSALAFIATKHGFGAEAYVTDLLSRMTDAKQMELIRAIGVMDVSTKTAQSISDSAFTIGVDITGAKTLGIDIKATSSKKTTPGYIKYTRGTFTRKMSEIFDVLDNQTAKMLMYLIANSFFYQDQTGENSYARYITQQNSEIYELLNAFRALLALIPSGQAVPTTIKGVGRMAKTDDRFVIIIDGVVFLMTQFLEAVRRQVLLGERGEGSPISRKTLQANLNGILNSFNSTVGGVKTKLYEDKVKWLRKKFAKKAEEQTINGYEALYNKFIKPGWKGADLRQWEYKIRTTTLTVRQ